MKRVLLIAILSSFSFMSLASASQAKWSCLSPYWVGNPDFNDDGNLVATLATQCKITLPAKGNVAGLYQKTLEDTQKNNIIHGGPMAETYKSLPGVRFDLTSNVTNDGGDHLAIRKIVHISSDQNSKFLAEFYSTQVDGTGNSAYLKKVNYSQSLYAEGAEGRTFQIKIVQMVELEKPWYAPKHTFLSQAKKSIVESFAKNTDKDVGEVSGQL